MRRVPPTCAEEVGNENQEQGQHDCHNGKQNVGKVREQQSYNCERNKYGDGGASFPM